MKSQILAISLICFFGDGHPLNDQCLTVPWEVDRITECRTGGQATPPNQNSGNNPSGGMVTMTSVQFEIPVVVNTAFVHRGYSSFNPEAMIYIVDPDLIMVDGNEECSIFAGHN